MADAAGIDRTEAIARFGWHNRFNLAIDEIRQRFPEDFLEAEIQGRDLAKVAFAAGVPLGAMEPIVRFEAVFPQVTVEVETDRGFNELDLQAAIESVHYRLFGDGASQAVSTVYDHTAQLITSRVNTAVGASPDEVASLAEGATDALAASGPHVTGQVAVEVIISEHILGASDSSSYHHGGEALSTCTSGFGTKTAAGVRGIATAGHCPNSLSDDGSSLTFKSQHEGTHGDFQWHTGPKTETDNFYAGSTTAVEVNNTDVSWIGAASIGSWLCKNGKAGYMDCGEVRRLNVCSGQWCNLVQMGSRRAASGDSGGPVYSGNGAYGIHQGWMYDPWPYDRDVFSRADRIDNAIGTYIATS